MKKIKVIKSEKTLQFVLTAFCVFFIFCIVVSPAKYIQVALNGLSAWALSVLPSILPFMFFTKILSKLSTLQALSRPLKNVSKALFNSPPISIYTFFMAILSGYPVGTKMVADQFLQGQITRADAFRMTSFCSTSGPMFIIGVVGSALFNSAKIGYLLFLSHVLGAILNGIFFGILSKNSEKLIKNKNKIKINNKKGGKSHTTELKNNFNNNKNNNLLNKKDNNLQINNNFNLEEIISSVAHAVLNVGVIICVFFIIIECLSPLFNLLPNSLAFFLQGLIEITKGTISLSTLSNRPLAFLLCSFIISFGGISTILQSVTVTSNLKMPISLFVFQKFMHAVFSLIFASLFLVFL